MNANELKSWSEMVNAVARLTPNERVNMFDKLNENYCFSCGYPQPPDMECKCALDLEDQ